MDLLFTSLTVSAVLVALGEFHAGTSQIVQPVFSASAVNKTTPGYYTLPAQVTIKLLPTSP